MKSHKLTLSLAALIFISCENQLELDPKQNESIHNIKHRIWNH
jgi:hypothetical protein